MGPGGSCSTQDVDGMASDRLGTLPVWVPVNGMGPSRPGTLIGWLLVDPGH